MAAVLALSVAVFISSARAEEQDFVGRTPPRLSLVEGQVSFWRPGAEQWEEAQVNLPLGPGDFLATGSEGRAEIQFGSRAFLRAAPDTELGIAEQKEDLLRVEVSSGRAALDIRDLPSRIGVEVRTSAATLRIESEGYYDITVGGDRVAFAARAGGRGTVVARGESMDLRAGTEVVAGSSLGGLARYQVDSPDEWETWNRDRTDRIVSTSGREDVSDDVYGLYDLDTYGTWRDEPEYGRVWVPSAVPPSWAPYTTGRWIWDIDYGWSWVDSAPWGWAPYHYGRWVWCRSYWGWAPGPRVFRPVYYPALVGFVGGTSFGLAVGAPAVSWVALGWGEPILPWWGPVWYRGRPCWHGWGGPTYINNVYVDRHHHRGHGTHRGHGINHYRNQEAPNSVVAVRRRDFANRAPQRFHIGATDQRGLRPVDATLPVEPGEVGVHTARNSNRPPRTGQQPHLPRGLEAAAVRSRSLPRAVAENSPPRTGFSRTDRGQPSRSDGASDRSDRDRTRPQPPGRATSESTMWRSRQRSAQGAFSSVSPIAPRQSGGSNAADVAGERSVGRDRQGRPESPYRNDRSTAGRQFGTRDDLTTRGSRRGDIGSRSADARGGMQPDRTASRDSYESVRQRSNQRVQQPANVRRRAASAAPSHMYIPRPQTQGRSVTSSGGGGSFSSSNDRGSGGQSDGGGGRARGYGVPHMRSGPSGGSSRSGGSIRSGGAMRGGPR